MHEILLGFLMMLAPLSEGQVRVIPLAALPDPDPCVVARQIAEQGACLRPEDCGAFEGWMRLFGTPRNEMLQPDLVERADDRFSRGPFPCPAPAGGRLARSGSRGAGGDS